MRRSRRKQLSLSTAALFLAGFLWIAAFGLPVFVTPYGNIMGYWVFVTGWMGLVIFQFAWYANLMMLMGVLTMYTRPIFSAIISGLGMLVATQAFWFDMIPGSHFSTPVQGQEIGFWCWYASILLLGFGVFYGADETTPQQEKIAKETIQSKLAKTPPAVELPSTETIRAKHALDGDNVCFFTGCKTAANAKVVSDSDSA